MIDPPPTNLVSLLNRSTVILIATTSPTDHIYFPFHTTSNRREKLISFDIYYGLEGCLPVADQGAAVIWVAIVILYQEAW